MSVGIFYYLVFLFFFSGGIPIDKVHARMTEDWPDYLADSAPWISPIFLCLGLYFWYSYTKRNKAKQAPEPEYHFEFNVIKKSQQAQATRAEKIDKKG